MGKILPDARMVKAQVAAPTYHPSMQFLGIAWVCWGMPQLRHFAAAPDASLNPRFGEVDSNQDTVCRDYLLAAGEPGGPPGVFSTDRFSRIKRRQRRQHGAPSCVPWQVAGAHRGGEALAHHCSAGWLAAESIRMGTNPQISGSGCLRARLDCQPRASIAPRATNIHVDLGISSPA